MKPPQPNGATLHSGWRQPAAPIARPRLRLPRIGSWGVRGRLAVLAVIVMAASLAAVAVLEGLGPAGSPAGAASSAGTAFLGTTTCGDWRDAGVTRRLTIVRMLAVAATRPDPENPGATLSNGAAYGLFQRICSGSSPDSTLLYESYNRAASFQSVRGGSPAISGGFGSH
jgi:hypothetical protein